ncbi:hypothetical protein BBO99_00005329 [Phytophthora kernoviae]|uniref:ATPase AAA-type core domain-containing protein n=2 Tax=Phytophthora kernoviae TaxID=325452 RepID=A0A3R7G5D4_9STRA|nr:hypothetical protein G195_008922 [Phytophthora kernoviae 00238/432]KAG2519842.1 hypothetical protein JM18_007424 [Phytophthora kernoviae]RLN27421.1 hypothetical protein BBI17_005469 [Phytophthora kernoviae]RLN79358.1 hypothetical protein BBO99_00005329 [Phytophthora kernoviae]
MQLEEHFNKAAVGQGEATKAVCNAVRRSPAELACSEQPTRFLFLRPTGDGKTELAKALAYELFDNDKHMIRIDTNEYTLSNKIEKAHPKVLNTLLQVLDDGRPTDLHGRTGDFANIVIIMTPNIVTPDDQENQDGE